jgi:hypothetical protein
MHVRHLAFVDTCVICYTIVPILGADVILRRIVHVSSLSAGETWYFQFFSTGVDVHWELLMRNAITDMAIRAMCHDLFDYNKYTDVDDEFTFL